MADSKIHVALTDVQLVPNYPDEYSTSNGMISRENPVAIEEENLPRSTTRSRHFEERTL